MLNETAIRRGYLGTSNQGLGRVGSKYFLARQSALGLLYLSSYLGGYRVSRWYSVFGVRPGRRDLVHHIGTASYLDRHEFSSDGDVMQSLMMLPNLYASTPCFYRPILGICLHSPCLPTSPVHPYFPRKPSRRKPCKLPPSTPSHRTHTHTYTYLYSRLSPSAHLTSEHPARTVSLAPASLTSCGLTSTRSMAIRFPVSCTHSAM